MALRQGQGALESAPGGALRRSDPSGTGIRRRRCGRGFSYRGPDTAVITDPRTLARIKALVIPPAWEDVWICADPAGPYPGHRHRRGRTAPVPVPRFVA